MLVPGIEPNNLVSDGTMLFWATNNVVGSLALDGDAAPAMLATDLTRGFGLAVDATSIFFTDEGPSSMYAGAVRKMARDGTGVTTLLDRLLGPSYLAIDATHVFWTSSNCVCEMSHDGSNFNLDVFEIAAGPLAVDATTIYYVDETAETIARVPIGGGTPTMLAPYPADSLAVSGHQLFWATRDMPGRIEVLDLSSTEPPVTIATAGANDTMRQLAIVDDEIYWYGFDSVERAKLDGSSHEVLSQREDAQGLAVDGSDVYWGSWDPTADGIKVLSR
jgi:hypothetical protein